MCPLFGSSTVLQSPYAYIMYTSEWYNYWHYFIVACGCSKGWHRKYQRWSTAAWSRKFIEWKSGKITRYIVFYIYMYKTLYIVTRNIPSFLVLHADKQQINRIGSPINSRYNSERSEVYTRNGWVCMASLRATKTSCSLWHSGLRSIVGSRDVNQSEVPSQRKISATMPHGIAELN